MKKLNTNDTVKVKLTDYGKDIYFHQYDHFNKQQGRTIIEPRYPKVDESGYTEFQLWHLMELYGNYIHLASELPFETNILI